MGLFNRLGRQVEQFKQSATEAANDANYRCQACDAVFHTAYEECQNCGSDGVEQIDTTAESDRS